MDWELGISRHKLGHTEGIKNNVVLYKDMELNAISCDTS